MGASRLFWEGRDGEKKVGEGLGDHVVVVESGGVEECLVVVGLHKAVEETETAEEEGCGTVTVAAVAAVIVAFTVVVAAAVATAIAAATGIVCQTLGDQLGEGLNQVVPSTGGRSRCHHCRR